MQYFRVHNDVILNKNNYHHFALKRELIPNEILSLSDVKTIIPVKRRNMAFYIAQILGESLKTTTSNIRTDDEGHKFLINEDYINEKCNFDKK